MLRRGTQSIPRGLVRSQSTKGVPPSLAPLPPVGQNTGIVVYGPGAPPIPTVKTLPLSLVEEVPKAPMVLTEIELLMRTWCEEHARQLFRMTVMIRCALAFILFGGLRMFWQVLQAVDRRRKGTDYVPSGLRIGSVVYFDLTNNGREAGRVVIGLLTENCPLYCEYFHRRCTGSGGTDESFRGMRLPCLLQRNAAVFGDGPFMQHGVPGYHPEFLPTEYKAEKPWRGSLSSIAYGPNKESPNFAIHMVSGDFSPQVFGIVMGGYEVIEQLNNSGAGHGGTPVCEWVIEGCGELCTLDKTKVAPMPWQLYESVSKGFDEHKFGPAAQPPKFEV